MSAITVKVRPETHKALRDLADKTGDSMQDVLARAVEEHRRRLFFEQVNAAYEALRQDPKAWAEELEERALWESTLLDGLDEEDW
jgi:hypothetical protein